MIVRGLIAASAASAVLFSVNACSEKSKAPPPRENLIFVKGDPKVYIKDTVNVKTSTIREDGIDFNAEYEASAGGFLNIGRKRTYEQAKSDQDPSRRAGAEASSAPPSGASGLSGENYKFTKLSSGLIELKSGDPKANAYYFKSENGMLVLSHVIDPKSTEYAGKDFEIIHYSSSPDQRDFSFLVYQKQQKGAEYLVGFSFRKAPETRTVAEKVDEIYEYMAGKGVKAGWRSDQPVTFEVCGPGLRSIGRMVDQSIKEINEVLAGRLEVKRGPVSQCPPFSDVNHRNIQIIDKWIEIPGPEAMVMAQTMVEISKSTYKIVEADMFVNLEEWQEVLNYLGRSYERPDDYFVEHGNVGRLNVRRSLQRTMTHEILHALGLHHKFDGTRSIMSYDDVFEIQDYDRRALQALYPVNPLLQQPAAPAPRSLWEGFTRTRPSTQSDLEREYEALRRRLRESGQSR